MISWRYIGFVTWNFHVYLLAMLSANYYRRGMTGTASHLHAIIFKMTSLGVFHHILWDRWHHYWWYEDHLAVSLGILVWKSMKNQRGHIKVNILVWKPLILSLTLISNLYSQQLIYESLKYWLSFPFPTNHPKEAIYKKYWYLWNI